jgi:hypothetical protein
VSKIEGDENSLRRPKLSAIKGSSTPEKEEVIMIWKLLVFVVCSLSLLHAVSLLPVSALLPWPGADLR